MKTYLYALFIVLFISCIDSNDEITNNNDIDYTVQNEEDILKYINENNLDAKKSDTGLYYVIENEGTGNRPTVNSSVKISFKGYFLDKNIFQDNTTDEIDLKYVIEGWKEGIPYFKEGGNGVLLIPSKLAYGDTGNIVSNIPGGSVLVFDIKLLEIK